MGLGAPCGLLGSGSAGAALARPVLRVCPQPHTWATVFCADPAEYSTETGHGAPASCAPGRPAGHPRGVRHAVEHLPPAAAARPAAPSAEVAGQHRGGPGEDGQVAVLGSPPGGRQAGGRPWGKDEVQLIFPKKWAGRAAGLHGSPQKGQLERPAGRGGGVSGVRGAGPCRGEAGGHPGGAHLRSRGAEEIGLCQEGPGLHGRGMAGHRACGHRRRREGGVGGESVRPPGWGSQPMGMLQLVPGRQGVWETGTWCVGREELWGVTQEGLQPQGGAVGRAALPRLLL